MKSVFKIQNPDHIAIQLTLTMTLGEARAIRDYMDMAHFELSEPWAAGEFRRQLIQVINAGERQFASGPIPTERPDG